MARSIIQTLGNLNEGRFIGDATDQLTELVKAIRETGKGGKLTIELAVKPASRGNAMVIAGKIKATPPKMPPAETIMFSDDDGNLLTDDPRQMKLDIRSVPDVAPDHANLKNA